MFEVEVQQSEGAVEFDFFRLDPHSSTRIPVKVGHVSVFVRHPPPQGGEDMLWFINQDRWSTETSRITYGVLPAGWIQIVPVAGPARKLQPGQEYHVNAFGGPDVSVATGVFKYQGP